MTPLEYAKAILKYQKELEWLPITDEIIGAEESALDEFRDHIYKASPTVSEMLDTIVPITKQVSYKVMADGLEKALTGLERFLTQIKEIEEGDFEIEPPEDADEDWEPSGEDFEFEAQARFDSLQQDFEEQWGPEVWKALQRDRRMDWRYPHEISSIYQHIEDDIYDFDFEDVFLQLIIDNLEYHQISVSSPLKPQTIKFAFKQLGR